MRFILSIIPGRWPARAAFLAFLVLNLAGAQVVRAQGGAVTLSGRVHCVCDGGPVAGATVQVGNNSATTDANGFYTLNGVAPGAYTATVNSDSYAPLTAGLTIAGGGSPVTQDFSLTNNTLVINAVFDGTITGDAQAQALTNAIIAAVQPYRTLLATPICVTVLFTEINYGVSQNDHSFYTIPYSQYLADLQANPSISVNDSAALAHMPAGPSTGINGNTMVGVNIAALAALGVPTLGNEAGVTNGTVYLNSGSMNFTRSSINPAFFDLPSSVQHEVNEILGIGGGGSALGSDPTQPLSTTGVGSLDFFRYTAPGVLSFTYDTGVSSYFSIDGGNTALVHFNQSADFSDYGDWGDGVAPADSRPNRPGNVQDAFVNPGTFQNIGPTELVAFDVAGYTLTRAASSMLGQTNLIAPVIAWGNPGSIVYGTALGAAQLNAAANVPGTYSYSPPAGTVLTGGQNTLTVSFTPTDTSTYKPRSAQVTVLVTPATPTVVWTNPAPVASGTALGAAQLNATASVPGFFNYTPGAGTVLPLGTNTLNLTFIPNDNVNYKATFVQVSLVVTAALPVITWANPAPVVAGAPLGAAQLNATASVPGSFAYTPAAGTVLPVGTNTLSLVFTPADTTDYGVASAQVTLVVTPASPVVTWASPAPIGYGTALGAGQLNASANVPGAFAYTPVAGTVLPAGTNILRVLFTPADTTDYTTAAAQVALVVTPAKPVVTWASPAPIVYGTGLGAGQLNATANVPGSFAYTPASGTVLPAGTNTLSVVFTPNDTTDYSTVSAQVTLVVTPVKPVATWSNPAPIVYGTGLGAAQLNATANVPGSFAYTPASGTVLPAGTNTLSVVFTPNDTTDYSTVSAQVTIVVTSVKPVVTWSNPVPIVYGTGLGAAQLSATASVAGSFAYTPAAGTVLPVGTNTLSVVFTPNDTTDYTTASAQATIVVTPAKPAITWSNPAPVAYGTGLGGAQLNATANVPGSFAYTPASGTVLPAGTNTLSVVFTPNDTTDYSTASAQVTLVVSSVKPVVTWSNPAPISYGTGLGAAQLNAAANVPGSFAYTPASGTVLPAGTNTLSVVFTPNDTTDYSTASAQVTLVVTSVKPVVSWSNPAPIGYGTALGAAQLNATASVPGSFAYTPVAGTVLQAGTNTLSVAFTPNDTTDYTTASAQVSLVVNAGKPVLTWTNPAPIVYGTALGAAELNATASVPGAFSYSVTNGTVLPAGTNTLSVVFTPGDTSDYSTASAQITLVVTPATPVINWGNPAPLITGSALGAAQLNATANVPGTFAYTPAAGTVLPAGSNTLSLVFTPTDTDDYTTATAQITIVVAAARPVVTWSNPAPVVFGTGLGAAQLNAAASVPGTFSYTPNTGAVLPAGTNTLSVLFTPTDTADYTSASAQVTLVVTPATPVVTWAAPVPISYGTGLGASQLDATANVPGSFAYAPAAGTVLPAGSNTVSVVFSPADAADYTTASAQAIVLVVPAKPVVTWTNPAPIVYGTGLGAAQFDASANVAGTFSYSVTNGTILPAGTNTVSVVFTPADKADYSSASAQVAIVVTPATPVITWGNPPSLVQGVPLSAAQLNATANVPGTFTYTPAGGAILPVGPNTLGVVFTPADSTDYTTATAQVTLMVNQAVVVPVAPVLTWAAPSPIVYGTGLGAAQLNATANVPGTFAYTPAAGTILPAGTRSVSVLFTPTDTTDYTTATAQVTLVVTPATPVLTWTNPAPIVYGTGLGAAQFDASANVAGAFSYSVTNGTILPAGTNTVSVVFTPNDTADYGSASAQVAIVVTPATPVITWGNPPSLVQGVPLSAAQLNATANVPGTFTYTPAGGAILPVGPNTLGVVFTPADSTDYTTAAAQVTLTVNQSVVVPVAPVLTWAAPVPIVYGTALGASQLNATANVPGTFSYTPAAGTILPAGTRVVSVLFTPTDTTDYTTASAQVTLVVNQAPPVITWGDPAPVTSGTAVGAAQLNATANVPGSFTYTPAAGTVLPPGTNILSVVFTPTDAVDYTTATAQATLEVDLLIQPVLVDGELILSWPLTPGFALFSSSTLGGLSLWTSGLSGNIVTNQGNVIYTAPLSSSVRFFRLQKVPAE